MQDVLDKKHTERKLSLDKLIKFVHDVIIEKPGFTGSVRVNFFDGVAKDAERSDRIKFSE
jgi:hypothetical protein